MGRALLEILLLILLVGALIWAAVVPFRILQRTGLQESPAERLLAGPPDREAADTLVSALQGAGMSMQGVQVQVLELAGTGERVVFTVLDASKGFDPERPLDGDSATDMLPDLAAAVAGLDVDRIAVYYVGEDGEPLFTVTHRVDAIQALEQGSAPIGSRSAEAEPTRSERDERHTFGSHEERDDRTTYHQR